MQIKQGFTLVQTLFVLFMVSVVLLLIPNVTRRSSGLNFEVHKVKDLLLQQQAKAIYGKRKETITIDRSVFITSEKTIKLAKGIHCGNHEIHFNERGNVNMARTITCSYNNKQKNIVIHIGNGNLYVK